MNVTSDLASLHMEIPLTPIYISISILLFLCSSLTIYFVSRKKQKNTIEKDLINLNDITNGNNEKTNQVNLLDFLCESKSEQQDVAAPVEIQAVSIIDEVHQKALHQFYTIQAIQYLHI